MNSEKQRTFEWYEFIPHVLAVITILCCVIIFAASFTGLAVLQFNWIQRTCLAVGAVVLVIMLLRWIGQDQQAVRMAQAAARPVKEPEAKKAPFEYMEFRVAGVSFPNDDGVDRQELLRAYRFGDAPFDKEKRITLRDLEFKGEPAFQILANGQCIGWVPKNEVPELVEKWDQLDRVTGFDVTGGGFDSDTDEKLYYGATLSIRFFL